MTLSPLFTKEYELIAATDASFIPKSGEHTDGLGKFYSSTHGKAEKGLEISTLAIVNVTENTAYNISTRQTPAVNEKDKTRVDYYLAHLQQDRHALPSQVRYLAADGYYSKKKFIDGVTALGLHQIGKLRHDANLRWLYNGEQKPRGRKKLYDGKVNFEDLSRFDVVSEVDGPQLYTEIVNCAQFDRTLRIVYIVEKTGTKARTALLFSTDLAQSAKDIVRLYKSRFQIEFLFRDAKQFLGLNDCQARCSESLDFHFNATMTALNLLKLEDRQQHQRDDPSNLHRVISIASWKARKFNVHLLERFSSHLGLDFNAIKSRPDFEELCDYGAIAA